MRGDDDTKRAIRWIKGSSVVSELADMAVLGDDWWGWAVDLGAIDAGITRRGLSRALDLLISQGEA